MTSNIRRLRPDRIAGPVRRVLARRTGYHRVRLGRSDRALYEALEQIRAGVPLNWTQVENDRDLQALSLLASNQSLLEERGDLPRAELRENIYGQLEKHLPAPKPHPQKQEPKTLAGFSEAVPVLTQAEEEVPRLTPSVRPWLAAAAVALLVIALAVWGLGGLAGSTNATPTFTWINFVQDGMQISETSQPAGWVMPVCKAFSLDDPSLQRTFRGLGASRGQVQQEVGFPISVVTGTLQTNPSYSFNLLGVTVSPCTVALPDPSDPGAMVKVSYTARQAPRNGIILAGSLVVFQGRAIPLPLNVRAGAWKELHFGQAHALYWHGGPYQDVEGTPWIGDVSVMAVEKGDDVSLYVGSVQSGITESMLRALVAKMQEADDQ